MLLLLSLAFAQDEAPLAIPVDSRTAFTHVTVWDAVDGKREVEALVIDGDTITHVGALPADIPPHKVRNLAGATVIPGLMDLHVHLGLSPGEYFRSEDPDEAMRHHLAAYVACGVTTVLDTGIPVEDAHRLRRLEAEGPAPDVHLLGPLVSPPGGYVSVVLPDRFPPAHDAEDVAEQFAAFDGLDTFGVKATIEEGMLVKVWPLYTDEVADAVFAEAAKRDQGVYAHAMSADEYWRGLDLGVTGFVHPTQNPKRRLIRALADQQVWVVSTLSVFDALLIEHEPERLQRAAFQRAVPDKELVTANDPGYQAESKDVVVASMLPDRHGFFAKTVRGLLDKPGLTRGRVRRMQNSVAKQHAAGVPIVLGSDSGNWPVFLTEFHGPTTLRELELLGGAGMSPTEALTAATWTPARMLGIEAEVGRIAPGMRADLVVLPADITEDLSAIWDASLVVRAGTVDTPDGWMQRLGTED
ncbi:MAG: hypothetical protein EP330_25730 [Deltaproteobacteria bacterium]|nr:MAG: hypothetical protein EP330_25730 [Deltaproteobacteria bacterium]